MSEVALLYLGGTVQNLDSGLNNGLNIWYYNFDHQWSEAVVDLEI